MKTKDCAFVSLIAFAMSSPVFAQQSVYSVNRGLGLPKSDVITGVPRYEPTVISPTRVGVKKGAEKRIVFEVHPITADSSRGFVVNFHHNPNEPSQAMVSASAVLEDGGTVILNCNQVPSLNQPCVFPEKTRRATIIFRPRGTANFSYRTYSTEYLQPCDESALRFCGETLEYNDHVAKFTDGTETNVRGVSQGDVAVFRLNTIEGVELTVNEPKTGDAVSLHVDSSEAIVNSVPTLRVKATLAGNEVEVGGRFPCEVAGNDGKAWDCKIEWQNAVPNLAGYTNPRIVFSSTRSGILATIIISGAKKTSYTP